MHEHLATMKPTAEDLEFAFFQMQELIKEENVFADFARSKHPGLKEKKASKPKTEGNDEEMHIEL